MGVLASSELGTIQLDLCCWWGGQTVLIMNICDVPKIATRRYLGFGDDCRIFNFCRLTPLFLDLVGSQNDQVFRVLPPRNRSEAVPKRVPKIMGSENVLLFIVLPPRNRLEPDPEVSPNVFFHRFFELN